MRLKVPLQDWFKHTHDASLQLDYITNMCSANVFRIHLQLLTRQVRSLSEDKVMTWMNTRFSQNLRVL